MKEYGLKMEYKDFIGLLVFFPFLKTTAWHYLYPVIDVLFDVWLTISFMCLSYRFVLIKDKKSYISLVIIFFFLSLVLSTIYNHGTYFALVTNFIRLSAMYMFVIVFIVKEKISYDVILIPLNLLFVINILCWLVFPNGMYTMIDGKGSFFSSQVWIVGGKNIYFVFILFGIVINELRKQSKSRGIDYNYRNLIIAILYVFNILIISKSATGIIGVLLLYSFPLIDKVRIFHSPKVVYVYLSSIILLIVILMSFGQELVSNMGNDLGEKESTLTSRIGIWANSIEMFCQHPYLGYGLESNEETVAKITQSTSHNKYLWILYRGGIVSFIFFSAVYLQVIQNLLENFQYRINRFLLWSFFALSITWLTEVYDNNVFVFGFLVICIFSSNIIVNQKRELIKRIFRTIVR